MRLHERLIAIAAATPDSAAALARMHREVAALGLGFGAQDVENYAPTYLEHTMHDLLAQNPQPYLRQLKMPVLALTGALDTETPSASQVPALEAQLKLAGNQAVTTKIIPRVNHFFQTNAPGQEKSLFDNPETFSPVELQVLADWLACQAGLKPSRTSQQ